MYRKLKRKKNSAFTLSEVVMASALLIIATVPILKALTSAHVTSRIIEHRTISLVFAQAKLDEVKARSIRNFTDSFSENNLVVGSSYLCNVTDSSVNSNLKKITVSVGYDLNSNNTLESSEIDITLATLLARRL